MNRRRYITVVVALLLTVFSASGQDNSPRQMYEQAEEAYQIGRIEEAKTLLESCVKSLGDAQRLAGYRLLSLCCLALDQMDEARRYAELVLQVNPYYTPTVDYPPRFVDMINDIKQGLVATVTTASNQSESVNEAPSPVTIITAEMIEELGYNKNLNQILAAYVPGMTEICSYVPGENMAMHGAYANGQELILIMENGHRMNNRFNNVGVTSYSISTEKIDHIEVLRGPASSLYGNVALSAVVNIITKSGRGVNGIKGRYGYGSYNTHKADLLMGTRYMNADITAWASIYNSDGQIRHLNDGKGYYSDLNQIEDYTFFIHEYKGPNKLYVDSYKNTPSYDFGFTFSLKGFNLMFSRKSTKKLYQNCYTCTYDYSLHPSINGIKPGYNTDETHAEIGYARQLGKWSFNAALYGDWCHITNYIPESDYRKTYYRSFDEDNNILLDEHGNEVYEEINVEEGVISFENAKETSLGGTIHTGTDYHLGSMKGSFLAGGQFEHFSLHSRLYMEGENFQSTKHGNYNLEQFIDEGKENNVSFFLQDKHYILPQLILNAGLRYDLKFRKHDKVTALSPRLALMYVPSDRFSLKLSYSKACADLAFYYRYLFSDLFGMNPQHLTAFQLSAMGRVTPWHLNYEVNVFYNQFSNLMRWSSRDDEIEGLDFVRNQGKLKNVGIEGSMRYANKRLSGYLALYYCHNIKGEYYYYNKSEEAVTGVPHFTLNLHGAYKLLEAANHELKVYGHASYEGRKLNFTLFEKDDYYVNGTMLFDLGLKYSYRQHLQLTLDCENLLNTDRYLAGPNSQFHPLFQRGRSLMASVAFSF